VNYIEHPKKYVLNLVARRAQELNPINVKHMVEVQDALNLVARRAHKVKPINVKHMVEVQDALNLVARRAL
jgi:LysM repeat protein